MHDDDFNKETFNTFAQSDAPPVLGAPPLDPERYMPLIADMDLSEEDARTFLETIWNILISFADMGFGLDPVERACGQNAKIGAQPTSGPENLVGCSGSKLSHPDEIAAHERHAEAAERTEL